MKVNLFWKDVGEKVTRSTLRNISDATEVDTLTTYFQTLSNAKLYKTSYVVSGDSPAGTRAAQTGKFDSIEAKMVVTLRYVDANDEEHFPKVSIPAPVDDLFEHVSKTGYRILDVQGEAIASHLSARTGLTYTYVRGTVLSDKTEAQT